MVILISCVIEQSHSKEEGSKRRRSDPTSSRHQDVTHPPALAAQPGWMDDADTQREAFNTAMGHNEEAVQDDEGSDSDNDDLDVDRESWNAAEGGSETRQKHEEKVRQEEKQVTRRRRHGVAKLEEKRRRRSKKKKTTAKIQEVLSSTKALDGDQNSDTHGGDKLKLQNPKKHEEIRARMKTQHTAHPTES